jgi:phosphohistidine phosphatase
MAEYTIGMQIYLLRHGIASDGAPGKPDTERALTGEGKKELRALLQLVHKAGVNPALILSSPYRRAMESARIAESELECKGGILESHALIPSGDAAEAWQEIRLHKEARSILLASHEPLMGLLLGYLLGGLNLQVDFKKGALARVDVDSLPVHPRGILKWMIHPKMLR